MTHRSPHNEAADAVHEGRPVDAAYVRGGGKGRRIFILLVVSLSAVAVLLLGMWLVSQGGFAGTNANTGAQAVDVQAFDTAAPAPAPAPQQPGQEKAPVAPTPPPSVATGGKTGPG